MCERNIDQLVASLMLLIGDLAYNLGMCPDWELNFSLQAGTKSTEPHQPGLNHFLHTAC